MLLASLLLSLAQATAPAAAQVTPTAPISPAFVSRHGGRLFISPMGEPFRPKSREDDGLADWFHQADRNHDGRLTLDEMQQDADRFFALLDVNHDGEIEPDEITRYEQVVAPEVQSGEHFDLASSNASDPETAAQGQGGHGGRGHRGESGSGSRGKGFFRNRDADEHQGAGRYGLFDLPEPVIAADTDFDRGVSLKEFRGAAHQRFLALDLDHKGYLTLDGLETIRPAPPAAPKAPERPRDDPGDSAPHLEPRVQPPRQL